MPPQSPSPNMMPEEKSHATLWLTVAVFVLAFMLLALLGFGIWYTQYATPDNTPPVQVPQTKTSVSPSATLGGSLYAQSASQNNPIDKAPTASKSFTAAANPFDNAYQNPFSQ